MPRTGVEKKIGRGPGKLAKTGDVTGALRYRFSSNAAVDSEVASACFSVARGLGRRDEHEGFEPQSGLLRGQRQVKAGDTCTLNGSGRQQRPSPPWMRFAMEHRLGRRGGVVQAAKKWFALTGSLPRGGRLRSEADHVSFDNILGVCDDGVVGVVLCRFVCCAFSQPLSHTLGTFLQC